jgi:hypothetical protein
MVFAMGFVAFVGFKTFIPLHSRPAGFFIQTDKTVYKPGDRIGLFVKTCKQQNEFKDISYQLEDVNQKLFLSIGHAEEIAVKGCFEIYDFTPVIPTNLFDNGIAKEGEYKLWIRVDQSQNPFRDPELYETIKFTIKT